MAKGAAARRVPARMPFLNDQARRPATARSRGESILDQSRAAPEQPM